MVGADDAAPITSVASSDRQPMRVAVAIWIAYGCIILAFIGNPAVRRTQEARVLETAREMLGAGFHGWMIPHSNGQVRLQKPPLAYWLAACGFELFGVSEWSGRLYAGLTVWLSVAVVFGVGKFLFDRWVAFFAAASLGGSYLFCRFTSLAETDGLMTFWLMVAISCIVRGHRSSREPLWFHFSAAATALAFMTKASGAFSLLFLVSFATFTRDWRLLWRWCRCGAPLTLLLLAAPWWIYALTSPEGRIIGKELHDVTAGEDHPNSFMVYFPQLFRDVAPCSLILPIAVGAAITQGKKHRGVIVCSIWLLVNFVPMCLIGNKQDHYLLPAMPPLMLLIGWMIAQSLRATDRWSRTAFACMVASAMFSALLPLAVLGMPHFLHRPWNNTDISLSISLAMIVLLVTAVWWSRGVNSAIAMTLASWMLGMPLLMLLWVPAFYQSDSRSIAAQLKQRFGNGPYIFYSDIVYLPLIFTINTPIDSIDSREYLLKRIAQQPETIILSRMPGDPLSKETSLQNVFSTGVKDQHLDVYEARR